MEAIARTGRILGVGLVAAGIVGEFCLYDVDAGTRAVMFDKFQGGIQQTAIGEGTHFRIPFVQDPLIMDIRSRPRIIQSTTGTKDLQMVNIALRILSRPDENELAGIYKSLGPDYNDRVLPSIGNEVLKSVVAKYNAEELLSKRSEVSKEIWDELLKRAHDFHLQLDDVSITHLTFGKEFAKAIENKQVAQQEAETQTWHVARADQERKAAIIRAEGEAEAALLISKAMEAAGNGFVEVRRIDTAREVAGVLARSQNITYLPSTGGSGSGNGGGLLLNLNADK